MKITINTFKELHNGVRIPIFGLGVYLSKPGSETKNAVRWAIETGYRHIDTASAYKNEADVGEGIRESGIARKDIFITTKLRNANQGYDSALKAFDESLKKLGTEYIDLYLIHWPLPEKRKESWKALERIYREKRCRAIGVSNYTIRHLNELYEYCEEIPVLNQVEFHPFLFQKDLLEFCSSKKIEIEAYSPLARAEKLQDNRLIEIGKKHKKTAAQVMIRWCLGHNLIVIPKSADRNRIKENSEVFDFSLDESDMNILNGMNENFRVAWDPTDLD